jgi:fibronectin type III domain protein
VKRPSTVCGLVVAISLLFAAAPAAGAKPRQERRPPAPPRDLRVTGATASTLSFTWQASQTAVTYELWADFRPAGSTTLTSATVGGLACDRWHLIIVDAVDSAGNRSWPAIAFGRTSACPDLTPPTTPTGLAASSATPTGITLAWSPSTDNVGVVAYDVSVDGTQVGTTADTHFSIGGLACGRSYRLGVAARDAAGNVSPQATLAASTADCPGPPTLYLSQTGDDANACTQAAPCLSFDRAYHAALPGARVEVEAGTYVPQTISPDATKIAPQVVFEPLGGKATIGEVHVDGSHVQLKGLNLGDGLLIRQGADDVTALNDTMTSLFIWSASNVAIVGGELYPGPDYLTGCTQTNPTCDWDSQISNACDTCAPSTNVLIDGVKIHGFLRPPGTDFHTECLQFGSAVNLVIRNSRFWDCATHDIFMRSWGATYPFQNVLIENNFFGATQEGYYSINIADTPGSTYSNVVVRYNSALQQFASDVQGMPPGSISFIANVEPAMSAFKCGYSASAAWDYNVYWDAGSTPCGPHDVVSTSGPGFVDPTTLDLHLLPGAVAIDHGDPSAYPATDIDGQHRPIGPLPDAGADERG